MLFLRRIGFVWVLGFVLFFAAGCTSFRAARLYQRGSAQLERGEVERALADLGAAAELAPHASEIQNHLGLALVADGQGEAARAAFIRAVELDCDNAAAQQNLAAAEARDRVIEGAAARRNGE